MGEADRLTWVGHATVLIELDGVRLLTDPFLRRRPLHLVRHAPPVELESLQSLDAVLISHLHLDHLDVPSLRRLGTGVPIVVPRGSGGLVSRAGFTDVSELATGETLRLGAVEVIATPAEHDDRRRPGGATAEPLGYIVAGARRVYFAGDTGLFHELGMLAIPPLDVALLPIWGWGPSIGPGHMGPREAARAAEILRPQLAVPIHWGTYFPQGIGWRRRIAFEHAPQLFCDAMVELAPGVEVRVLEPGDGVALETALTRSRG
jgi:L-ascorbate metabolism protein UlaG (beta-lactamase superfamily)